MKINLYRIDTPCDGKQCVMVTPEIDEYGNNFVRVYWGGFFESQYQVFNGYWVDPDIYSLDAKAEHLAEIETSNYISEKDAAHNWWRFTKMAIRHLLGIKPRYKKDPIEELIKKYMK